MKRGYSTAFPVLRGEGKRYTITDVPAGFWSAVRAKARRDGVSMRALILTLLKTWLESERTIEQ